MSQPEKSDKPSDKKQKARRHLSGGEDLLRGFLLVQESCAEIGSMATPRRYMTFLHCYRQLYRLKKEGIEHKQQHLQVEANTCRMRQQSLCLLSSRVVNFPEFPEDFRKFPEIFGNIS